MGDQRWAGWRLKSVLPYQAMCGLWRWLLWKVHNCGKDFIIRSREIFQDYFRFVPQEWFPPLQASLERALHSSFWSASELLLLNWTCQLIALFHRCDNLKHIEPESTPTVGSDGKSFIKGGNFRLSLSSCLKSGACGLSLSLAAGFQLPGYCTLPSHFSLGCAEIVQG